MPEINEKSFNSSLTKVFAMNGMSSLLSMERCDAFYRLTVRMLEENEKYNLTAIVDPDKIILNHYADCATLAARLKKGASVIDVGCGAGFPTLPLAIVRPDLKILAVDSTAKRINYVDETAKLLVACLGLLFVAPAVNILAYWKIIAPALVPVCVIIVTSLALVFIVAGLVTQALRKKGGEENG